MSDLPGAAILAGMSDDSPTRKSDPAHHLPKDPVRRAKIGDGTDMEKLKAEFAAKMKESGKAVVIQSFKKPVRRGITPRPSLLRLDDAAGARFRS